MRTSVMHSLLACAALAAGTASAASNDFSTRVGGPLQSDLDGVTPPACNPTDYTGKAAALARCQQCKKAITDWKKKLSDLAKSKGTADASLANGFGLFSGGATRSLGSTQTGDFGTDSGVTSRAGTTMANRSALSSDAKTQLQQCTQDVKSQCRGIVADDASAADKMYNACQKGANNADQFAKEQGQGGMNMGDLAKLAQAAAQAMQAMQPKQDDSQSGQQPSSLSTTDPSMATSPTPDSQLTQNPTEKSDLGNNNNGTGNSQNGGGIQPNGVGFGGTNGNGVGMGTGSAGSVLANGTGGPSGSGTGASGFGNEGSTPAVGAATGGGGAGGLGGVLNTTGASKALDGSQAGASGGGKDGEGGNNYEMNMGGGRSIVGLKAGKGDVSDVADGNVPTDDKNVKLDSLGNREPAAENGNDDILAHDGESIFLRIRQKYTTLQGSGKI